MSAIDQVKAHFQTLETRIILVPEWAAEDGKPMEIIAEPMTLADRNKLVKYAASNDLEYLVRLLILKAKDKAGNNLFTLEHKFDLMRKADPVVIERIANEILRVGERDRLGEQ